MTIIKTHSNGKAGGSLELVRAFTNEKFLIVLILLIGAIFRFYHLIFTGLDIPYRMGGLFLEFANQIARNNFAIPINIPFYTRGGIPFAYPPLPFYLESLLIYKAGLPSIAAVNLLPPTLSFVSLVSFLWLAREAGLKGYYRLIALAAFAVMPAAFEQQIEGAGIAEATGTIVMIWFFYFLLRVRRKNRLMDFISAGIFWALAVMASPGSAYASVFCFLAFAGITFLERRDPKLLLSFLITGVVALAVSSPYWLTVIHNHGIGIFLQSVAAQHNEAIFLFMVQGILSFMVTGDNPFMFIWNVWLLVCVVLSILKKEYLLLAWWALLLIIVREGKWMISIPSALILGLGTEALIAEFFRAQYVQRMLKQKTIVLVGAILFFIWAIIGPASTLMDDATAADRSISQEDMQAMLWMKDHLPADSQVIVISGTEEEEWLPEISQRTVVNTAYGTEWQPAKSALIQEFNETISACVDLQCIRVNSQRVFEADRFTYFIDAEKLDRLANEDPHYQFKVIWRNDTRVIGEITQQ